MATRAATCTSARRHGEAPEEASTIIFCSDKHHTILHQRLGWIQESIIGSRFEADFDKLNDGQIQPTNQGRAFVCSEGTLIREAADPYRDGIE